MLFIGIAIVQQLLGVVSTYLTELLGWAATNQVRLDPASPQPGLVPFQVSRRSNPMPVCLDTLPECQDLEPNDTMAAAQPVALPVIVNGRIVMENRAFRLDVGAAYAAAQSAARALWRRMDAL